MDPKVEERAGHFDLDGENTRRLPEIGKWLEPELDGVFERYYARTTAEAEASTYWAAEARLAHASAAPKRHWSMLFGANVDMEYRQSVDRIGRVHFAIRLHRRGHRRHIGPRRKRFSSGP